MVTRTPKIDAASTGFIGFRFSASSAGSHLLDNEPNGLLDYCQRADIAYSPALNREGNYFGLALTRSCRYDPLL